MLVEIIEDVFPCVEEVKWSNKSQFEIGFNYRNKLKKTAYFFGIWYDLWEKYGIPLYITLDYGGKAPIQWHDKVKKFISDNYKEGLQEKDYEGFTCILFEHSFYQFDVGDDKEKLTKIFCEVTEYADAVAT